MGAHEHILLFACKRARRTLRLLRLRRWVSVLLTWLGTLCASAGESVSHRECEWWLLVRQFHDFQAQSFLHWRNGPSHALAYDPQIELIHLFL